MEEAYSYIMGLHDVRGNPLHLTSKRIPFIGFCMAVRAICGLFDMHVRNGPLKYLLTYKMSQGHLELFFCSVRSGLGQNNNPTCLQFQHRYKKLLLHHEVKAGNGNCFSQDETVILCNGSQPAIQVDDSYISWRKQLDRQPLESEHD